MPAAKALRRHLPQERNSYMLQDTDPAVLASKCRVQDVKFQVKDKPDVVVKTFVRIKTLLPGKSSPQFIMRQAHDNYISATSMFRAIFPGASMEEEEHEMTIIRRDFDARTDEHASGLWIPASDALQLAEIYGIEPWIATLLAKSTETGAQNSPARRAANKTVQSVSATTSFSSDVAPPLAPPATPRPIATAKSKAPKIASPKKVAPNTSATDKKKDSSSTLVSFSEHLVDAVDGALAKTKEALQPESLPSNGNGQTKNKQPKSAKKRQGEATSAQPSTADSSVSGGLLEQLKHDASEVLSATQKAPQSVAEMLAEAKQQVAESRRLDAQALSQIPSSPSAKKTRPRKRVLEVDEATPLGPDGSQADLHGKMDPVALHGKMAPATLHGKMEPVALHGKMEASTLPPNKRTKIEQLEVQVAAERRKVRALVGLVLGLGATAILPYVL